MDVDILTAKELQEFLRVSELTMAMLIKEGLPCFRVKRQYRFDKADVVAWLKTRTNYTQASPKRKTPPPVVTDPAPMLPVDTLPLPIEDTPPVIEEPAPKSARPQKTKGLTHIERAARLDTKVIDFLASKTAGDPQKIIHTKQGIIHACPLYIEHKECCADIEYRTPSECPLKAFADRLKHYGQ